MQYSRRAAGLGRGLVVAGLCAALAACSGGSDSHDPNPQVYKLGDDVPEGGGAYKIGKAYQIKGRWYRPKEDRTYQSVGVASWYGEYFHGRKTANGEWYDMERLSAAHPTLPLPTYARVTNLENGRSVVVRVNDRGPFARDREIDMSFAAAKELGFVRAGTAKVHVKYIADAPLEGDVPDMQYVDGGPPAGRPVYTASQGKSGGGHKSSPLATQILADAPLPGGKPARQVETARTALGPAAGNRPVATASTPAGRDETAPPARGGTPTAILPKTYFVQAASFRNQDYARSFRDELAHLGVPDILAVKVGTDTLYRVRLGPYADIGEALGVQTQLARDGRRDARVVKE